jgi:hypothetical protein
MDVQVCTRRLLELKASLSKRVARDADRGIRTSVHFCL